MLDRTTSGSARALEKRDFLAKARPQLIALDFEVVMHLESQPELLARAKVTRQLQGRIYGDRPRPVNDLVDAPGWHVYALRLAVLAQFEGLQELLLENLAGVNGRGEHRGRRATGGGLPRGCALVDTGRQHGQPAAEEGSVRE